MLTSLNVMGNTMGIGSLLRKLTGGGSDDAGTERSGDSVEYQGYTIRPAPKPQNGQYLTAGYISKSFPEGDREQYFIRADTHPSFDGACSHAVSKGQQIINEQGDSLFQT